MTILISSSVKTLFANRTVTHRLNTTGCAITVYSGAKPTTAAYQTNFAASYSSSQPAFLWHANGLTTWARTGNTVYMSTSPTPAVPVRNGTAAWAVLWLTNIAVASMTSLPGSATTSGFIICDVSTTLAGTGIVQFPSTTFATTDAAFTVDTAGFSLL